MKITIRAMAAELVLAAALSLAVPHNAEAVNTASGTAISNTATVNFQVGGVAQTAVTGSTSFTVDNKVNLLVTKNADATVVPGSANQALSFTITNLGNTAQRYALSIISSATDSFDMTGASIYRDSGGTAGAWDAGDTLYVDASTFGDIASGATVTVLIVGSTPIARLTGETAVYDLVATAVDAGTTNVTAETGGANTAGVDVVFADTAGSAAGDGARDGKHSAVGTYTVSAASLTVSKAAAVYSDPFNVLANPKAIPGAVITYTVQVSNAAGGSQATNVAITDDLSAEITAGRIAFATQFSDGVNNCGVGQGIVVAGVCNSNAADADNGSFAGNIVTSSGLTINANSSVTIKYQVVIQ